MALAASSEGIAPFTVPNAGKDCGTWYCIFGELSNDSIPLIALHGGPGAAHGYLSSLEDLAPRIPVVFYDQLGCGRSTALPEKNGDRSFWNVELFEREIDNLVKYLGITHFDLFGHSWGGMLASVYAAKQPQGLRKLIIMSAPASAQLSVKGILSCRDQLPQQILDTMRQHEANWDHEAPAYKQACMEFYKRFVCRCDPWPPQVVECMTQLEHSIVYATMRGPSELVMTGVLKGWTAIPEAHKIHNTTLIINGQFDEIVEDASAPYFEEIPKVKWVILPNSSHMGMWEERERLMHVLSSFLAGK